MEKKQENGAKAKCASSAKPKRWEDIDWAKCESEVRKLQVRVAKAHRQGHMQRAKSLQRILTKSFAAKALAVRRVTSNKGGATPGVDKATWLTKEERFKAISTLKTRGYQPMPLRRVFIPKKNGKKRPLGIPTIKDRAMQALFLMALEPTAETTADHNSYGFRRHRCCADAIDQIYKCLHKTHSAQWVLEGDIKGCFDHISHEWLMEHVLIDKEMLRKWLKAGVIERKVFHITDEGTPQGGIISPTLANITLDGMEKLIAKHSHRKENGKSCSNKVHLIRYADDFIITGESKEILEEIKLELIEFLKERGLELSIEKTLITHINDGFDFLGFNVRKYRHGLLLIKPSKNSQKKLVEATHEVIHSMRASKQEDVIGKLNPKLRGWANYYRYVSSKVVFSKIDHIITHQLIRWAKRRHHNKSFKWIKDRYWHKDKSRSWAFCVKRNKEKGDESIFKLFSLAMMPIIRYTKIKSEANPFDPLYDEYFRQRQEQSGRTRPRKAKRLDARADLIEQN